jgi:hypothetical protein
MKRRAVANNTKSKYGGINLALSISTKPAFDRYGFKTVISILCGSVWGGREAILVRVINA